MRTPRTRSENIIGSQGLRLECAFELLLHKTHPNLILWFPCFLLVNKKFQGRTQCPQCAADQEPVNCEHELFSLVPDQDFFLLLLKIQSLNARTTESFTRVRFTYWSIYIHATEAQMSSDRTRTRTYQNPEMMAFGVGVFQVQKSRCTILILHF